MDFYALKYMKISLKKSVKIRFIEKKEFRFLNIKKKKFWSRFFG